MRNMSFMLTTQQILDRTKTVTRRMGWANLKPGTLIRAVEKGMGLKKGEKVKTLATLRVVKVNREPLWTMLHSECAKEGFPKASPAQFVRMFCESHKGCKPDSEVTRIEFEYVDVQG